MSKDSKPTTKKAATKKTAAKKPAPKVEEPKVVEEKIEAPKPQVPTDPRKSMYDFVKSGGYVIRGEDGVLRKCDCATRDDLTEALIAISRVTADPKVINKELIDEFENESK